MKILSIIGVLLVLHWFLPTPGAVKPDCRPENFAALKAFFRFNPQQKAPFIMAHRGGPGPAYPENCLLTFQHTLPLPQNKALYEQRFRAGANIICTDRPVEVAKIFGSAISRE